MNKTGKIFYEILTLVWSTIFTVVTEEVSFANGSSPLCENRHMGTVFTIVTESFNAAICGQENTDPQCSLTLEPYVYIGQSRKTRESIVLSATDETQDSPFIMIYKAKNNNYTYQMSSSGGYTLKPWTSLSVFKNGKRIYYRKLNKYNGEYDC